MEKKGNNIIIDGVVYIPVKDIAIFGGYTTDYVGQLCREGKLEATRVGRAWYVSELSIISYKENQIANSDEEEGNDIIIDEVSYISVKDAASLVGYTSDYVGQLCREGKLEATRIGRAWYVSKMSIITHKERNITTQNDVEHDTTEVNTERTLVKPEKITPKDIFKESSFVVYEKDERPLLPTLEEVVEEALISIPNQIEEKISKKPLDSLKIEQTKPKSNSFATFRAFFSRALVAGTSFAVVFLLVFSLNSSYAGALISDALKSTIATVVKTEAIITINSDILDQYRLVAVEINRHINFYIEGFMYEEVIYDETLKR